MSKFEHLPDRFKWVADESLREKVFNPAFHHWCPSCGKLATSSLTRCPICHVDYLSLVGAIRELGKDFSECIDTCNMLNELFDREVQSALDASFEAKQYEDEVDELSYEVTRKTKEIEKLKESIKHLETFNDFLVRQHTAMQSRLVELEVWVKDKSEF